MAAIVACVRETHFGLAFVWCPLAWPWSLQSRCDRETHSGLAFLWSSLARACSVIACASRGTHSGSLALVWSPHLRLRLSVNHVAGETHSGHWTALVWSPRARVGLLLYDWAWLLWRDSPLPLGVMCDIGQKWLVLGMDVRGLRVRGVFFIMDAILSLAKIVPGLEGTWDTTLAWYPVYTPALPPPSGVINENGQNMAFNGIVLGQRWFCMVFSMSNACMSVPKVFANQLDM